MNETRNLIRQADTFALTDADDAERCLEAINLMALIASEARRVRGALEEQVVEWLEADGNRLEDYYVTYPKTTKAVDQLAVAEAVIEAVGGDLEEFVKTLGSGAFKPATVRTVVGEEKAERLFVTTRGKKLKVRQTKAARERQWSAK